MLKYLSLSLQFVCVESLTTAMVDMYPEVFRRKNRRELFLAFVAFISFLMGLVMLMEVGITSGINPHGLVRGRHVPGDWVGDKPSRPISLCSLAVICRQTDIKSNLPGGWSRLRSKQTKQIYTLICFIT